MEGSNIQKFYKSLNVLITGGTGFMGKILIEKLLRSTEASTLYVLIREKNGKNAHSRIDELFDDVVFDKLKAECPKFKHRIVAVPGDCSISGLGLAITDRQKLISEVHVVFHVAATVKFNEQLQLAYTINVNGVKGVLDLARQMKNLKAMIHVSTAFSNCHLKEIDERFYDCPYQYEDIGQVLEKMNKNEVEQLTPRIITPWPNTYTFTKALAESVIRDTASGLPLGIYRPAIVISTYKEPIEGWIDNLYGPTGVCAGSVSGVLRVMVGDTDNVADVVPADTCVAGLIASAWDVASRSTERTTENIPIYNYVSSSENPITWNEFVHLNMTHGMNYPVLNSLWVVSLIITSSITASRFLKFFLHILPALVVDTGAVLSGHKPRMLQLYKKVHNFTDILTYFCMNSWTFSNKNTVNLWSKMNLTDRELFPVSMTTVHWTLYFRRYIKGMRLYLLKEPDSTLEKARKRYKRLMLLNRVLIVVLVFVASNVLSSLCYKICESAGGMEESNIQKFYKSRNVLITGGTGFIGKILIEKLLRSTEASTLYVLIREKYGKNAYSRIDELFDDVVFGRLKAECPEFKHRIVAVPGDCSISGLGLAITDKQKLMSEVHVVFHVAATVKFNEQLQSAYAINVNGVKDVLDLARQMKNLKAMIHVSTAFSNCHLKEIDERFYDCSYHYEDIGHVLEKMNKNAVEQLTPRIITPWPNTYAFTKALAESLIKETASGLPLGIYRPAIVISTYNEPLQGWIDNPYGLTGVCVSWLSGVLRVMVGKTKNVAQIVPADTCVAGLIASAWDVASRSSERTVVENIPIYNYVPSENLITWNEFIHLNTIYARNYPVLNSLWVVIIVASSNTMYRFLRLFLHTLPALVFDTGAVLSGHKPRMLQLYKKVHSFTDIVSYFFMNSWTFSNKNTVNMWAKMNLADRELFPLSMITVHWTLYFRRYIKGMRLYLLKEPDSTLEEARKRYKRLMLLNRILVVVLVFVACNALSLLCYKMYSLVS
ncbi:hypothetical protein NQ315_000144 [Exocentrus adspersus]|uniref:Fatty acyl-CoA reductase n=1 Tax=Exocentrus adspersus TaxID=1586481 RepID=A0AAV8VPY5_9CUCU|nr:hypothetical protein NQ315_000144 [Exocentrus adspersus]